MNNINNNIFTKLYNSEISDNEISDNEISDNEISDNEISINEISINEINNNKINNNKINNNKINNNKINNNKINNNKINNNKINNNKINNNEISNNEININEININEININEISNNEINNNEISNNKISINEISINEISINEISINEISNNEISDNEISDNEISDNEISDNETIDKSYKDPIILEKINLEYYFNKSDIETTINNNKKLKITDKGLYSISKYYDAEWITNLIINFLKNININSKLETIIDGTSGIGGNTIHFSKYFKKVYSIEINNIHYDILNNNIDALSISNVETYLDNFLNKLEILKKKSNIFFFDPPWGGKSYKNYKYFNLKVGKLMLNEIIDILYDIGYKYVILKAPINLNISLIYNNIKYHNINVHSNKKKNMIIIIFY